MARRKKIPKFNSEAAEREFWAKHDIVDYVDLTSARAVRFPNLKPSLRTISLLVILLPVFLSGCFTYNPNAFMPSYLASPNTSQAPEAIPLSPVIEQSRVHPISKIIVRDIEENSPAEKAGFKKDDEILSVNGETFSVFEKYSEYLRKTRWLDNEFRIVRREKGTAVEKEIKITPEKDYSYHGILHKFEDNNGHVFYPRYSANGYIYQGGKEYDVSAAMSQEEGMLQFVFRIDNRAEKDLAFDKSKITFIDRKKEIIPVLLPTEVLIRKYQASLARSPMAALQTLPTMTAAKASTDNMTINIPVGTNRRDEIYIDSGNVNLPVAVKMDVEGNVFSFEFDRSR